MYLGDDLVTHFLVASVQQLRKCRSRYHTSIRKLGIGNPGMLKELF